MGARNATGNDRACIPGVGVITRFISRSSTWRNSDSLRCIEGGLCRRRDHYLANTLPKYCWGQQGELASEKEPVHLRKSVSGLFFQWYLSLDWKWGYEPNIKTSSMTDHLVLHFRCLGAGVIHWSCGGVGFQHRTYNHEHQRHRQLWTTRVWHTTTTPPASRSSSLFYGSTCAQSVEYVDIFAPEFSSMCSSSTQVFDYCSTREACPSELRVRF